MRVITGLAWGLGCVPALLVGCSPAAPQGGVRGPAAGTDAPFGTAGWATGQIDGVFVGTLDFDADARPLAWQAEHDSTTPAGRGVELTADGSLAHVGMGTASCDVLPDSGSISTDYNLGGDDEQVTDVGHLGSDEVFVTTTRWGRVSVNPAGSGETSVAMDVGYGLVDARIAGDHILTLVDLGTACEAAWRLPDGPTTTALMLPHGTCDGSLAVDPVAGDGWIGTESGVFHLSRQGLEPLHPASDARLAWDGELLYVATADGVVRALTPDGAERWSVAFAGPALEIAASPAVGVAVAIDTFWRQVVLVDPEGGLLAVIPVDAAPTRLALSDDATRLAVHTSSALHFHTIGEAP